ncbi:hypothetical protein [Legionella waltersii]|uniref:Uncharacterized protein n=1 Tax=Legionella waltersii TaxID=66969 RepID=A0A0W1ADF9_9GAMM|nr:hypothetical protein [Legionella waltersii]KTD79365.1 hypothetical protein Lwal_1437 [Legionella waltersii]SNU99827.1 Uncharacterised protein [Legionella waltersii]
MPSGKAHKQLNKRTIEIKRILTERYISLGEAIRLAIAGQLIGDEIPQLLRELLKPVQLSGTLIIQIEDCHPSTGRYKKALPKGYLADIATLTQVINKGASILPAAQEPLDIEKIVTVEHQASKLQLPDPLKMNKNIFVLIEQYLAEPSDELVQKIKRLSHDLTNQAYEAAKKKFPLKVKTDPFGRSIPNIGGDEYNPILMENMIEQAKEGMSFSTRLMNNNSYEESRSATERPYLFKISKSEQLLVKNLIGEMLSQVGKQALHPEGLVFAYDGYIERQSKGRFNYVEGRESSVYEHNAKLYLKAMRLAQRGEITAASILTEGCDQIKAAMLMSKPEVYKCNVIKSVLLGLQNNQILQEHRGFLKSVITNFLLIISGVGAVYLAATANDRGTFFYHPNTDTCNQVSDFENQLSR